MNEIEENPKGGGILLGIGILAAIGVGIWAITRGGQAQNGNGTIDGCVGTDFMSITGTSARTVMNFFNQRLGLNQTLNTQVPHEQLAHSLNIGDINQTQHDCGMAQLNALGI